MNKKIIAIVVAVIVVVGAIIGVVAYRNYQAEQEKIEKQYQDLQSKYDTAKEQAENCIEDMSATIKDLEAYQSKITAKEMSEEDSKAFEKVVKDIKKAYDAGETTCKEKYEELQSVISEKEEGYFDEETLASITSLFDKYQPLFEKGQYKAANDVLVEASNAITAYIREANAKAEAEAQANANRNSSSGSTASSGSGNRGSSNNSGSSNGTGNWWDAEVIGSGITNPGDLWQNGTVIGHTSDGGTVFHNPDGGLTPEEEMAILQGLGLAK